MQNEYNTDDLKKLILVALFSDDELAYRLVFKGGNALSLAHHQTARASVDLDFSLDGSFELSELPRIRDRIRHRLEQTFLRADYRVFDVFLEPRPENITPDLESFWGGYGLEFKVIPIARFEALGGREEDMRREAIPSSPRGRARFEVDISRHEYCEGKVSIEIEHFTIFVYTPTMIVCEKIRAICQQAPDYLPLVNKKHQSRRARDVFDIHQTVRHFRIDLFSDANVELVRKMFKAKRVPLQLLGEVADQREHHRQDWTAVIDTVSASVRLKEFDYYFDYVAEVCEKILQRIEASPRGT